MAASKRAAQAAAAALATARPLCRSYPTRRSPSKLTNGWPRFARNPSSPAAAALARFASARRLCSHPNNNGSGEDVSPQIPEDKLHPGKHVATTDTVLQIPAFTLKQIPSPTVVPKEGGVEVDTPALHEDAATAVKRDTLKTVEPSAATAKADLLNTAEKVAPTAGELDPFKAAPTAGEFDALKAAPTSGELGALKAAEKAAPTATEQEALWAAKQAAPTATEQEALGAAEQAAVTATKTLRAADLAAETATKTLRAAELAAETATKTLRAAEQAAATGAELKAIKAAATDAELKAIETAEQAAATAGTNVHPLGSAGPRLPLRRHTMAWRFAAQRALLFRGFAGQQIFMKKLMEDSVREMTKATGTEVQGIAHESYENFKGFLGWCFLGGIGLFVPGFFYGLKFARQQLDEQLVQTFYRLAEANMTKEKAREYLSMAVVQVEEEIGLRWLIKKVFFRTRAKPAADKEEEETDEKEEQLARIMAMKKAEKARKVDEQLSIFNLYD